MPAVSPNSSKNSKNSNNPPHFLKNITFLTLKKIVLQAEISSNCYYGSRCLYFTTPSGHTYVGSSVNLFVRVTSYFYTSILESRTRPVLVHFLNMDLKV